jgi:hypothetical protein
VKSSSRLLMGFGIGITALVLITVALALALGQKNAPLLSSNTPEGVVQRFLLAVQNKDYPDAYAYLLPPAVPADDKSSPRTFEYFSSSVQNISNNAWKANLGKTSINGENAIVEITLEVFVSGGPFGNPIRSQNVIFSLKKVGSAWLIASPTDMYWLY